MGVEILRVGARRPEPGPIARAAAVLHRGGLVAFPTETVYGLGALALDPAAVERIFAAKGRPAFNPLIVHVSDLASARVLVTAWPAAAEILACRYWPGPLTLVLPKRAEVPDRVTAGLGTVAVRVPAHPVALALLTAAGVPIAAPSANPFTRLSPTTAGHVLAGLEGRVDLVLDAGPTTVGIESTVVDLSGPRAALLRPGSIAPDEIEALVGRLERPEATGETPRPGPGMLERHYAPGGELWLFSPEERSDAVTRARRAVAAGRRVGALLRSPLEAPLAHRVMMPEDPEGYGRELYAALHELERRGCDLLLVERVPEARAWSGIRDRLERAAR